MWHLLFSTALDILIIGVCGVCLFANKECLPSDCLFFIKSKSQWFIANFTITANMFVAKEGEKTM